MTEWEELVRTDPGTPMGRLLRSFWQPVAVASKLLPGKALPVRVMGEDLTLYRGASGASYLVDGRCAHRRTTLSIGWIEGECIRCRYHGWKYDGTGQCVEMPAEDPSFPPKVRITSYPIREYAGLIFAYLGEGEPPEFRRWPELDRAYGVQWASVMVWPCNWFQRIENSMDGVHVSFVHQNSPFGDTVSWAVPKLDYEETDWGLRMTCTRGPDNVRVSEYTWPNCNHIVVPRGRSETEPWTDLFNWFVPVDDEHTYQFSAQSAPVTGEAAERLREWVAEWEEYNPAAHHDAVFRGELPADGTDLVHAQDYITQVGQGTIYDRSQERLGRSDTGIILMRRIFRRELDAIEQGLPGKQWRPRGDFGRLPIPPGVEPAPDLELAK